jgi:multidrug efflux pump subunit AcrB
MMMPVLGISINILSLFAFIMVLGIVVDDAIVIGESAYSEVEKHGGGVENVVKGAKKVATPATFGVLTTIAVFAPVLFASGPQGDMFFSIAGVAILCLVFSLIESKLILPAHLSHMKVTPIKAGSWREKFNAKFFGFVNGTYKNFLNKCVEWRWFVLMVFFALLFLSIGLLKGDQVRMVATPKVPHDFPSISIEMNETVSDEMTINAIKTIEQVIINVEKETVAEYGTGMVKDILAYNNGRTEGRIMAPLVDEELRPIDTFELARRWR